MRFVPRRLCYPVQTGGDHATNIYIYLYVCTSVGISPQLLAVMYRCCYSRISTCTNSSANTSFYFHYPLKATTMPNHSREASGNLGKSTSVSCYILACLRPVPSLPSSRSISLSLSLSLQLSLPRSFSLCTVYVHDCPVS